MLLDLHRIPLGWLPTGQALLDVGAQLLELDGAQMVLLLHQAEGFAKNLAGGGVEAGSDFDLHHRSSFVNPCQQQPFWFCFFLLTVLVRACTVGPQRKEAFESAFTDPVMLRS